MNKKLKNNYLNNNSKINYNELCADLEKTYHLTYNLDDKNIYLFDHDKQTYIESDERTLQEFLAHNEDIRLNIRETKKLLDSVIKRINNNYNYIEFNNKLLNLKTNELEEKAPKNKPRPFITPKRINYDVLNDKNNKSNSDNTIVYKTLKQILGTEDNIKDFKQRLGSMILNEGKYITIYYSKGANRGKTILLFIIKLVLGILARNTKPEELGSNFNQELFNNINALLFDETNGNSFKDTEDRLKKVTGGGIEEETRKIYSSEIITTIINTHILIGTNELPNFKLSDIALFNRISIIELSNKFSSLESEVNNKTVFPINDNIQDEIKKDVNGIKHLIYDSIKEYRSMKEKGETFINKKGIDYAKSFYLGEDILLNFLSQYTKLTENKTENTTADDILDNFKWYIKDNNIDYLITNTKKTKQEIGIKLKKIHDNIIKDGISRPILYKNLKCIYVN